MLANASAVVIQGRWRLKNVREKSRLAPCAGSDSAHQNMPCRDEVRGVRPERAALVDEPRDRLREHHHEHRRGDQREQDLAHAAGHRPAQAVVMSPRAARRDIVGNITVAMAIENSPCGSW